MNHIINILCAALILLIPSATSEKWIAERDPEVIWWEQGIDVPAPIKYNGTTTKTAPVLDGRSLVDSWLNPRAFVCNDPGWQACATQLGCCPTAQLCCPNTPYCKNASTDTCCPSYGTCPSGWECTSLCKCIESGGECCSDGNYCQKGNICVVSPYGVYGCCTDLSCTAYVSSGVTVPLTPTYTPTQPATTRAPQPTITQGVYIYYYYTITWSYYYYYYYTFFQVETTSTLTSSYTTVYTTVSIYESNSAAASSSFNSISSAFVPSTPAAATTALAQQTGTGTSPAITAAPTRTGAPLSSFSSPSGSSASSINTSLRSGGGSGTASAGGIRLVFGATVTDSWIMAALAFVAFVPGIVMLIL